VDTNRIVFKTLGPALAALRRQSGKTGPQVAKEIGRSHTIVYRYEHGYRELSTFMLFRYLTAVNASLVDLHEAMQQQLGLDTTNL
jgi:transcriptional regulator with XRE-family HTH domain